MQTYRRQSDRRQFLQSAAVGLATVSLSRLNAAPLGARVAVGEARPGEDVFSYIKRANGQFDSTLYKQILGAANAFKEGDEIVGVAAADNVSRRNARLLLSNTSLREIDRHPVLQDDLSSLIEKNVHPPTAERIEDFTLGDLKQFLEQRDESAIRAAMPGLSSVVIASVVKLMTNAELIAVGAKIFNPLPGSRIGAKGYLGARIQPNSPTDNVDDIRWQVLDGWSYAVGDVLLGTNPVSSDPNSVAAVERTLQDLLVTFSIDHVMPHCVLSHIDVQAEVERTVPGTTALWFQSIAGSDKANATFDIDVEKMLRYADARSGPFGLYFETGQGADFTNGHGHGFDMVIHESRKYGFAKALADRVLKAQSRSVVDARSADRSQSRAPTRPWVHLNDVAGFIGPEVFRTREQLVRCCLEDILMGKLHGLCIGLDVCSTLHMDISLDDLDWCLDRIMPANPAYLMALPTKIDPMLGYLTTGYQDHVRLREKFGLKVNDPMWQFFQQLGVIDADGRPTEHFGDPLWVYLQYCRRKDDQRSADDIRHEGETQLAAVRERGVFIARGHGDRPSQLTPELDSETRLIYADAKQCIWAELDAKFIRSLPGHVHLTTRSADRADYILHPETGERLSDASRRKLGSLRRQYDGRFDVQVVVSDGLNTLSITEPGHLEPFLNQLTEELGRHQFRIADRTIVVTAGRVRAGYRIGENLFGDLPGRRAILHLIGERPGSGHRTFSVYMTAPSGSTWGKADTVDHNITKVVSGIATTALEPRRGARETVRLLRELTTS